MQPPRAVARAIGEIGANRADRSAEARAGAVAGGEVRAHAGVPGVAGVEECGDAPVLADPVRKLDAADQQAPPADNGARFFHADALERVAAHRLVAARAKEKGARDALARLRAHRPGLAAQQKIVA